MLVRRRPLTLQAPLEAYHVKLKNQDYATCARVFIVILVAVTQLLYKSVWRKERAEWEERIGGRAPPQRPRKDVPASHIYLVFCCLGGTLYVSIRLLEFCVKSVTCF